MQKTISVLIALLLAALLLCSCSGGSDTAVSVQSVSMITGFGSVGLYDRYAGVVEAGETFPVEKDPDMEVKERLVSAGDEVKAGDILFTYDTEAVSLELEKKELELEQLNASITTKTAQAEQLEKEKNRAPASEQLDYTLQIQELQVDVSEAKLNVTAKEKEIERYRLLLENAEVTAPVDGRVQTVNDKESTDDYGNPQPYMTIAQADAFRVKGSINEQSAGSLTEGMQVTIRSRTDSSVTWSGTIERIDWNSPIGGNANQFAYEATDEFTSASKYPFHVALDSDEGLMLGQHVYIEPSAGVQTEAMMLPASYINDADTAAWVWAANGRDRLEKRSLTLGAYDEALDAWEVLDGLTAEDYIAFPDETCVQGAAVIRYDENSFGDDLPAADNFFDGGAEGEFFGDGEVGEDEFFGDGVIGEDEVFDDGDIIGGADADAEAGAVG